MTVGAIILAAGASSRMGTPKATLVYRGATFLNGLAGLYSRFCDPVVAVLGYHADAVRQSIGTSYRMKVTENPAPERGMLSSLQCGLRALPAGLDGFLFTPVDLPAVSEPTVRTLLDRFRSGGASKIVIPVHSGRNGHPVLCPWELAAAFLALDPAASPKSVIAANEARVERIPVDDVGTVNDIDTPRDYEELSA